jgi:hypothetical protein
MKEPPERAGERPGVREALRHLLSVIGGVAVLDDGYREAIDKARAALSSPSPDTSGERGGVRERYVEELEMVVRAARVQYEAHGAYPGLVEAFKRFDKPEPPR